MPYISARNQLTWYNLADIITSITFYNELECVKNKTGTGKKAHYLLY